MAQGGDRTRTGLGGQSSFGSSTEEFKDELIDCVKHTKRGIVSMANVGPDIRGSQFFITFKDMPHLDGKHIAFGHVIDGFE